MKYLVLVGDGMADTPVPSLGGKTPLEAADKPNMDFLASHGETGMVSTVPDGMVPESDTANLALMGYDPKVYSRGRSPLEALSMGIDMKPDETAIRSNIVSVSDLGEPYEEKVMLDHSADEISTEEARVLIEACDKALFGGDRRLYTGVSYRHCLIWKNAPLYTDFSRPHDILSRIIGDYLPKGEAGKPYLDLMKASFDVLNEHPLNLDRVKRGLKKANSLWFWSPGKKPSLPSFKEQTGLDASVVCAVDLIKGIGLCAGMDAPVVEGATGAFKTNYHGKAVCALEELKKGKDLVYIHIEAPDECGHRGETENKVRSIELIDNELGYLLRDLDKTNEPYRILLTPDHPTPLAVRTHILAPVPYVIYDSRKHNASGVPSYTEANGKSTGIFIPHGFDLMKRFAVK